MNSYFRCGTQGIFLISFFCLRNFFWFHSRRVMSPQLKLVLASWSSRRLPRDPYANRVMWHDSLSLSPYFFLAANKIPRTWECVFFDCRKCMVIFTKKNRKMVVNKIPKTWQCVFFDCRKWMVTYKKRKRKRSIW